MSGKYDDFTGKKSEKKKEWKNIWKGKRKTEQEIQKEDLNQKKEGMIREIERGPKWK